MRDHTPRSDTAYAEPGLATAPTEPGLAAFGLGTVQALDTGLSGPFIGELRHGASVDPGTPASYGLDLEAVLARGYQQAAAGRGPAVPASQHAPRITVPVAPAPGAAHEGEQGRTTSAPDRPLVDRTALLADAGPSLGSRRAVACAWLGWFVRADRLGGTPCSPTMPPARPTSPGEASSRSAAHRPLP